MKKILFSILLVTSITACKTAPTESQKQMLQRHYDQNQQIKVANDPLNSIYSMSDIMQNHPNTPI